MNNQSSSAHDAINGEVPRPLKPRAQTQLPRPLTFFLNAKQRTAVLRALRTIDRDRAVALLVALDIAPGKACTERTP